MNETDYNAISLKKYLAKLRKDNLKIKETNSTSTSKQKRLHLIPQMQAPMVYDKRYGTTYTS